MAIATPKRWRLVRGAMINQYVGVASHRSFVGGIVVVVLFGSSQQSIFYDFAHIPWEDTPNFPKPPQRKKFLHKLNVQGIFQRYVGEILDIW